MTAHPTTRTEPASPSTPIPYTRPAAQPLDALTLQARYALDVTCARRGHDTTRATVLQNGFNQVVRLPHAADGQGVVAKIHKPGTRREAVDRQVLAASWALAHRVPTARPLGRPTAVGGLLVSFTEDLGPGRPADPEERAVLLALLHAAPIPDRWPDYVPAARLLRRLAGVPSTVVPDSARREVRQRLEEVGRRWEKSDLLTRRHLIHGDAGAANTVVDRFGIPHLVDWETAAAGPPAVDLAAAACLRDHFGHDPREYRRFAAEYGTDITRHPDIYHVLAVRAACAGVIVAAEAAITRPQWQPEYLRRLACLSGLDTSGSSYPWSWRPGSQITAPHEVTGRSPETGGPAANGGCGR
ncbi:uncharacterized protein YeaO (DUF488 family) [Kitasatospora gansuensis]|uniref:Uncharacterized protein YeaO (DUF488 family) n=1 Tax=Kitasatospora gansuensis TaxID=258050 RepID=A0A7W7SFG3_9ACTN|nr:phosphotransferase [Kitasatospora gansuensis]MBB4949504.1 uncharacterized protein YeaO (DUF488 family) [Kitasatospora gansuensis]